MKSPKEILDIVRHSYGTYGYYKVSLVPNAPVVTDGVKDLALAAECFWLLDFIISHQGNPELDKEFQVWTLEVDLIHQTGVVRGLNDTTPIIEQKIPFTDFPLHKLKLYLINGVILLPSEY
jgi:hypothetical protein